MPRFAEDVLNMEERPAKTMVGTYKDANHSQSIFFAREQSGKEEDAYGDGDRSDGEIEFIVPLVVGLDDDNELYGETKEKEKVEF